MSDQPETLAAILQSARNRADNYRYDGWESVAEELEELCNRIDAAAARERDEDRRLAAIAESDEAFARCARCDRPERAPGNAACEAWKKICAACAEGAPPARCAYYGEPNGCNAPTLGKHPEGDLAERLQEALEKAERRIEELERTPGSAAAMCAALERLDRIAFGVLEFPLDGDSSEIYEAGKKKVELPAWCIAELLNAAKGAQDAARAALAAPSRNVDRFADIATAITAFSREVPDWEDHDGIPDYYELAKWLFAPAEGGAE